MVEPTIFTGETYFSHRLPRKVAAAGVVRRSASCPNAEAEDAIKR